LSMTDRARAEATREGKLSMTDRARAGSAREGKLSMTDRARAEATREAKTHVDRPRPGRVGARSQNSR